MTYILCRWMNKELRLSQDIVNPLKMFLFVEPHTFARTFSNGYLIGEILHKYHLINDLRVFDNDDSKSSKVNNFNHLKPTLLLLGISLDDSTAQALMQEKQDVASHLIHELYVALEKKKKGNIGGTVADMVPNASSTHLSIKEQNLYSERLHRGFRLSANMKFNEVSQHIENEDQQFGCKSMEAHSTQQKKPPSGKDKIKRRMEAKVLQKQQEKQWQREKHAQTLQNEIQQFEANTKKHNTFAKRFDDAVHMSESHLGQDTKSEPESMQLFNSEYIRQIRLRLELKADTQKQKERRTADFLMEQSKAQKALLVSQTEDSFVKHLNKQTEEEERLVAQLLQIRSEREELTKNNLTRQQQNQKRREKEYKEALEREAALIQQERFANAAEIQRELDLCKKLTAERKQNTHMKHFNSCKKIMGQIVDLATKAGDYYTFTGSLIPGKQMKEWKELLFRGLPLYDTAHEENKGLDTVGLLKQYVTNNQDYEKYKNMVGEWEWSQSQKTEIIPTNSSIFDHVILQLRSIVHPSSVKPFPPFSLKACVLGKSNSGKSMCLDKIAQAHGVHVLSTNKLVEEVLKAHHSIEKESENQNIGKNSSTESGQDPTKKITNDQWALLGEAVNKVKGEGKAIPNELLVDIVTETIRQLPANSGWILDGFPVNITQAHLLEKALGGTVEEVDEFNHSPSNLTCPPIHSAPALHLALLLDISDEHVSSRAGNQTGMPKQRIADFEATWPELEEWFGGKQNILVRVNADVNEEEMIKTVESILQQLLTGPLESSLPLVDEPFPLDLATSLCLRWDAVWESYVNKVKGILQNLWLQQAATEQQFFNYREEFKLYLNRTDPKHDLISQWQKDYRFYVHREKDKAKLDQKLDDLLEELWDISDKRREENEQKMAAVKEDGWLESCIAMLQQHHSTLLQVEVERFREMLYILKSFFLSLCRQTMANKDHQLQEENKIFKVEKQFDPFKTQHVIYDYEDALTTICTLISAEAQLLKRETQTEDKKSPFSGTDNNNHPSFNQSLKDELAENVVLNKIWLNYLAAINEAGNMTKARISLLKFHNLEMANALRNKADQVINSLKMLVNEQFVEEMKSIEHVAEVVRHHVEADPVPENGLVLLSNLSFQNVGDCSSATSSMPYEKSNTVEKI